MNAKLGSDGRLTLSGWFLNQLDSPSFVWRTKALLSVVESIVGLVLRVKGYYRNRDIIGNIATKCSAVDVCRWA